MRTASEIVDYLTRYYQAINGQVETSLLPPQISDLVGQMGEFLEHRLEEDTPFQQAYDAFKAAPEDNDASLVGILETIFEAQPGVKVRVDGFMQGITALEVKDKEHAFVPIKPEDSLRAESVPIENESVLNLDSQSSKVGGVEQPTYLYGNERAGFEADPLPPATSPFQVGQNAQIIYLPDEKMKFPFMFMQLGKVSEDSDTLTLAEKEKLQINLENIRAQLTKDETFDESQMANAFQAIWEVAPSYADALIESLQRNIDDLPAETRRFVFKLHSPYQSNL